MKYRHPHRYAIASALLMAAAGCATPDTDGPQAWKIQPVFNVKHAMESSQGYYTLGRYYDGSQAWDKAIDAYRKAITIDALNIEAYNALGVALAQSGRYADAETTLRQAVALAPALAHLRSNLGYVLLLAGKPLEALPELKAAVQQDSRNATAVANLRNALAQSEAAQLRSAAANQGAVKTPEAIPVANGSETVGGALAAAPAALRVIDQPTIASLQQPVARASSTLPAEPLAVAVPLAPITSAAPTPSPGLEPPASRLEVSNGNGVAGMAASVGRWLAAQGLQTARLTNQRPFTQQQTVVEYRDGHEQAALRVARSLPTHAKAVPAPMQGLRSDVRVVLGRDWVQTAACLERNSCQPVATSVAEASDR